MAMAMADKEDHSSGWRCYCISIIKATEAPEITETQ
jgi:hypothetical protein